MKTIEAKSLSKEDLLKAGINKKFNGFVLINEAKNSQLIGHFNYYYPILNGKLITFTVQYNCDECGCSKIVHERRLGNLNKLPRSASSMKEVIEMSGHSEGSSCISYLKEQIRELKEIVDDHRYCMKSKPEVEPEVGSLAWDRGDN